MPVGEIAGAVENRLGLLLLVTWKSTICVLPSPSLIAVAQPATVCVPASSSEVCAGPAVKLGTWLIALTLIVKVCGAEVSMPPLAVPPLSVATTLTVAMPDVPFCAV